MRVRPVLALAAALGLSACGYHFTQRYVARGGAERIGVQPFENASTEPELGAVVTAALRTELARRGAEGAVDGEAVIEGEVHASEPTPTSAVAATAVAATWRIGIVVRARLLAGGVTVAEHTARREADYLAGADPLETESRRALALRRIGGDAAREILRAFER